MARYVLAPKRGRRSDERAADVARAFPGMTVVGPADGEIVTVEAEPSAVKAFRASHGGEFLIEKSAERSPPLPGPGDV